MAEDSKKAEESRPAEIESEHGAAPTSVQSTGQPTGSPAEAADASLTSGKDARQKQALELNVEGEQAQRHPDTPAGQHATGSFTDEASKEIPKGAA